MTIINLKKAKKAVSSACHSTESGAEILQNLQQKAALAQKVISCFENAKANRSNLEQLWEQVNSYVRPQRSIKAYENLYDTTAVTAAEYLVAGLWGLISSSAVNWFTLKLKGDISHLSEAQNEEVKNWLNGVNKAMVENLSDPENGFYHKSYEFYADLICYGTAVYYVTEDVKEQKLVATTCDLQNTYILQNNNKIDCVIKNLQFTLEELVAKFGAENLSPNLQLAYAKQKGQADSQVAQNINSNNPYDNLNCSHQVLHIVAPVSFLNLQNMLTTNMPFASVYIHAQSCEVLKIAGFHEFPYMVARWGTNAGQVYGQSPAMGALADIKMINAMSKTMIVSAQMQVDPPILAPNDMSIQGLKTNPGGIIFGGIDSSGNQLIKPLQMGTDISYAHSLLQQRKLAISESFYNSLLLFTYSHNATATEVLSVNEQKLRILGSKIARIQGEFLHPFLKRQFSTLNRLNLLQTTPSCINPNDIEIQFVGPWNRYQNMLDSISVQALQNATMGIANFDKTVIEKINWEEVVKIIAKGNGIPDCVFKNL